MICNILGNVDISVSIFVLYIYFSVLSTFYSAFSEKYFRKQEKMY